MPVTSQVQFGRRIWLVATVLAAALGAAAHDSGYVATGLITTTQQPEALATIDPSGAVSINWPAVERRARDDAGCDSGWAKILIAVRDGKAVAMGTKP